MMPQAQGWRPYDKPAGAAPEKIVEPESSFPPRSLLFSLLYLPLVFILSGCASLAQLDDEASTRAQVDAYQMKQIEDAKDRMDYLEYVINRMGMDPDGLGEADIPEPRYLYIVSSTAPNGTRIYWLTESVLEACSKWDKKPSRSVRRWDGVNTAIHECSTLPRPSLLEANP